MNNYKKIFKAAIFILVLFVAAASCKKLGRPALGSYPADIDPHFPLYPGGPLKFYAAFDGTSTNPLMNAVDSIRANFPSSNTFTQIAGISGKAVQGDGVKVITYAGSNDFLKTASSFTIALWEKHNGAPQGNAAFFFNVPSSNGYWAGASMFGLFDQGSTNDLAIIKIDVVDAHVNDNWFQWVGNQRIQGIQDNNWHHLAFVYDAATSVMTLYVDGVANPNTQNWGTHGAANMDATKATGFDIGGNSGIHNLGWGTSWDGGLDQFRLYSKALTAAEVTALYTGKL